MSKSHVTTHKHDQAGPNSRVRLGEHVVAVLQTTPTVNVSANTSSSNVSSNVS